MNQAFSTALSILVGVAITALFMTSLLIGELLNEVPRVTQSLHEIAVDLEHRP